MMSRIHTLVEGTERSLCGKRMFHGGERIGHHPDAEFCETCTRIGEPTAKSIPIAASPRKELSKHDLDVVKRAVKSAMSGGYSQVYAWFGEGAKEHWADSITLGIVTGMEGVHDADWVHRLRLAVYQELRLETVDVASPFRMSDLTGSKK